MIFLAFWKKLFFSFIFNKNQLKYKNLPKCTPFYFWQIKMLNYYKSHFNMLVSIIGLNYTFIKEFKKYIFLSMFFLKTKPPPKTIFRKNQFWKYFLFLFLKIKLNIIFYEKPLTIAVVILWSFLFINYELRTRYKLRAHYGSILYIVKYEQADEETSVISQWSKY